MELRKCECGGDSLHSVVYGDFENYVFCSECGVQTEDFITEDCAIQAWNEGKVE